jgi:hypothetical protein
MISTEETFQYISKPHISGFLCVRILRLILPASPRILYYLGAPRLVDLKNLSMNACL